MKQLTMSIAFLLTAAAAPALSAQGRGKQKAPDIPAEYRPPAGMCRIWLDDVPANQQPAPTDCPTAVKNKPQKGRVIFGDDYVKRDDKGEKKSPPPFVKSFTPPASPPPARRPY
jgi:hypothetical protein